MQPEHTPDRRWLAALAALAGMALFLVLHSYNGMVHDARLYTIQALNHLQPQLYGNDVFVRFGSQDDFTLFSPLYSAAIAWLGVESAAAGLTFATICLFLSAAWMLARSLLPVQQSAVAMLLLLLLPAFYGPGEIFHFLEEFVTPRQLAEALTLLSLAAWFRDRQILAALLSGAAMLVHPIMGLGGIAFLVAFVWGVQHHRKLWPLVMLAGLFGVLVWAGWLPASRWQFDTEWHQIVMRRTYLGLQSWDGEDWGRVAVVLATLGVSCFLLNDIMRRIAVAMLLTTTSMLTLALVGGDLLKIIIVVQAQLWRVLWLATVLAILLLPPLFVQGWRGGPLARCALLLLAGAWSAHFEMLALMAAPLALLAASNASRTIAPRPARLLLWGSCASLILIVFANLATSLLAWNDGLSLTNSLPPLLDDLRTLIRPGIVPAILLLVGACLAHRFPSRPVVIALTLAVLAPIVLFASPSVQTWTSRRFTPELRESFEGWRALIPAGSDVMWVSNESKWGDGATNAWLLLQRPSFLSGAQAPNALFSRAAAIEMHDRAEALWGLLPFTDPFRPRGEQKSEPDGPLRLAPICDTARVGYVVTTSVMTDAAPIPAPTSAPPSLRDFNLYTCT